MAGIAMTPNFKKMLQEQSAADKAALESHIDTVVAAKATETQNVVSAKATEMQGHVTTKVTEANLHTTTKVSELQTVVVTETGELDTAIGNLVTVNGEISNDVQAVNAHTTAAKEAILSAQTVNKGEILAGQVTNKDEIETAIANQSSSAIKPIQRGTFAKNISSTDYINIASVNTSKTRVFIHPADVGQAKLYFSSSTQVAVEPIGSGWKNLRWEVVEYV